MNGRRCLSAPDSPTRGRLTLPGWSFGGVASGCLDNERADTRARRPRGGRRAGRNRCPENDPPDIPASPGYDASVETLRGRAASFLIAVATALAIIALVLPLFLNPVWVAFEQGRSDATAWTGFSEPQLRTVSDAILTDLVIGPPDFDVALDGRPILNERERSHMRDVRGVFVGFFAIAAMTVIAAAVVAFRRRRAGGAGPSTSAWAAVRNGAAGLIVALALVGTVALVAFDALFEIFHQLFFSGGTYTFDPSTERLVQLFPFQFWQETAVAVGVVAAVVAALIAFVAHGRARARARATAMAPNDALSGRPAPGSGEIGDIGR